MKIYMVRHGQTLLNAKGCYYGQTDVGLNEKGRDQANTLREGLSGISFAHVFVSPLLRAKETAGIILGDRPCGVTVKEELSEQNFGIFEGLTYEELKEKYPEELNRWNRDYFHYRIPEGESFSEVRDRADLFLKELARTDFKREDKVLIVAHKGTLGHLMASLLNLSLSGYWNFVFEQGCYNRVDLEDGYAIVRKLNQSF